MLTLAGLYLSAKRFNKSLAKKYVRFTDSRNKVLNYFCSCCRTWPFWSHGKDRQNFSFQSCHVNFTVTPARLTAVLLIFTTSNNSKSKFFWFKNRVGRALQRLQDTFCGYGSHCSIYIYQWATRRSAKWILPIIQTSTLPMFEERWFQCVWCAVWRCSQLSFTLECSWTAWSFSESLSVFPALKVLLYHCPFWQTYRSDELEVLQDNDTVEIWGFENAIRAVAIRAARVDWNRIWTYSRLCLNPYLR